MTRDDVFGACPAYRKAIEDHPFGDEVVVRRPDASRGAIRNEMNNGFRAIWSPR